jgi:hypothetical protein
MSAGTNGTPKFARHTMTDPAEREAVEQAWRLLHLQADAMLKLAQARTQVWKVALAAFIAGGVLVLVTAVLTAVLVVHMVDAADDQADDSCAAYRPARTDMRIGMAPSP